MATGFDGADGGALLLAGYMLLGALTSPAERYVKIIKLQGGRRPRVVSLARLSRAAWPRPNSRMISAGLLTKVTKKLPGLGRAARREFSPPSGQNLSSHSNGRRMGGSSLA